MIRLLPLQEVDGIGAKNNEIFQWAFQRPNHETCLFPGQPQTLMVPTPSYRVPTHLNLSQNITDPSYPGM